MPLALLQGGMSGCETDWGVFLKTLIISSSKIVETSSELNSTSSELIRRITEQNFDDSSSRGSNNGRQMEKSAENFRIISLTRRFTV